MLLVSAVIGLILSAGIWQAGNGSPAVPPGLVASAASPIRFTLGAVLTTAGLPRGASITAHVHARAVLVYPEPNGLRRPRLVRTLRTGTKPLPLVVLVAGRRRGWLKILLPVRPNLSEGWIRSAHVSLHIDLYHLNVTLATHQLEVWRGTRIIDREPVGVGTSLSPTPDGRYYITDLLRPPNPNGLYGPYAFGLSAYSPVYTSFAGGDGQIGLHGTDYPAGIGHDVSHGCIRLSNSSITKLARLLPIGTPVVIQHQARG